MMLPRLVAAAAAGAAAVAAAPAPADYSLPPPTSDSPFSSLSSLIESIMDALTPKLTDDALLYVAAYSGAVQTIRLSSGSAEIVAETRDACGASPSWLTLNKQKDVLYCIDEGLGAPHGGLWLLRPDRDGKLVGERKAETLPGPAHGVLHADGGNYTLSHYGAAAITTIDTGDMHIVGEYHFTHALAAKQNASRQTESHPHQAVVDPTGRFLYVADLGADVIHVFSIDAESQLFTGVVDIALPPGSGPRHVAFAVTPKDGAPHAGGYGAPKLIDPGNFNVYMYIVTELHNTLHGLRVEYPTTSSGPSFTPVFESTTHGPGAEWLPREGAAAAEVLVSPDNRFLLLSSRFDARPDDDGPGSEDTIATFAIEPSTGRLGVVGEGKSIVGAGGGNPRHMSLNAAGTRLAVALQRDARVVVFERDPESGVIGEKLAEVETAAEPVAVVWNE